MGRSLQVQSLLAYWSLRRLLELLVLQMRSDGKGWGQVAQTLGFKLGDVMRNERAERVAQNQRFEKPQNGERMERAERPEKPGRPQRPERPERPEKPERPVR